MCFLDRDGDGPEGLYSNTATTDAFLDKNKPSYIGGILEMFNARLFEYWNHLGTALRTGEPQNEIKATGRSIFEELYKDPAGLEAFLNAMTGISAGSFMELANKFDFSAYESLCDVGGATGQLCAIVAQRHADIRCTSFDLPVVAPIAQSHIDAAVLSHRVTVAGGDFLEDPLPKSAILTMGPRIHT